MNDDLDPLETAEDRKSKLDREERDRVNRLIEINDFKWLMGHKQGRRIVWRWLERFGVFRSSFSPEALAMAFREGQRNGGLLLIQDVHEHAPEKYVLMIQEHKDANRSDTGDTGNNSNTGSKRTGGNAGDE